MHVNRPMAESDRVIKNAIALAFTRAAQTGVGHEEIASKLRKHVSLVYKYADPNDHSAFLSVHDVALLTPLIDVTPILEAMASLCGGVYTPGKRAVSTAEGIRSAALKALKEGGDVAGVVDAALADGALTPAERNEITRQILEEKAAMDVLLEKLGDA